MPASRRSTAATADSAPASGGSQTLMRGLDVLETVAGEMVALPDLAERLGLTKSTTHRLASALVERGYLSFTPRLGYRLGAKLLELGARAQTQTSIVQVARPHLEALSAATEDTVHLGVLDNDQALYLDKAPGQRRITISSRIGDRHPLTSTGLGKALMLDHGVDYWTARLSAEKTAGGAAVNRERWLARMHGYVAAGRTFDLEENEDQIRCVAAPIRNATHRIIGAISVSSAAQYMTNARMERLSEDVRATAAAIGRELGWDGEADPRPGVIRQP